jgi:ppGpp synthetase/RelA/SpoT-type nucleotidyltranferase
LGEVAGEFPTTGGDSFKAGMQGSTPFAEPLKATVTEITYDEPPALLPDFSVSESGSQPPPAPTLPVALPLDYNLGFPGLDLAECKTYSDIQVPVGVLTDGSFTRFSYQLPYLSKLSTVEERYPGVVAKLKQAEEGAHRAGYTPTRAQAVIEQMRQAPPWPAGSYPDNRARIAVKAQQLAALHPQLQSREATTYDLPAAQEAADKLLDDLVQAFPEHEFPNTNMAVRAKTPGSLANKMTKQQVRDPEYSLAHVTDTVGARMDCTNLITLGKMANKMEQLYKDKIVAKKDMLSEPGSNGYRALHYTVDLGDRMAEIQLTTQLLRATDLATHDTLYKPQIPLAEEESKMLATAADRAMFHECIQAILEQVKSMPEEAFIAGLGSYAPKLGPSWSA